MNTAQQELQQLHQQQADVLAHREKDPIASAVTPSGREDYIKQGDAVAARVSAIGAPDEWILARVMNISSAHARRWRRKHQSQRGRKLHGFRQAAPRRADRLSS